MNKYYPSLCNSNLRSLQKSLKEFEKQGGKLDTLQVYKHRNSENAHLNFPFLQHFPANAKLCLTPFC